MKKTNRLLQLICLTLLMGHMAIGQETINRGSIKFQQVKNPKPEAEKSILDDFNNTITFSFSDEMLKMDKFHLSISTTYKPSGQPEKGYLVNGTIMSTEVFSGLKEEDYARYMDGIDIGKFIKITYDKLDTKTILGYECYRANLILADKSEQVYYITEKILAPSFKHVGQSETIAGYPLEIQHLEKKEIIRVYKAINIEPTLSSDCFQLPIGVEIKPLYPKNSAKENPNSDKAEEPAKPTTSSPDTWDSYLGYKLGSKKSDYPKKNFIELRDNEYRILNGNQEKLFDNRVYQIIVRTEKKIIKQIDIEFTQLTLDVDSTELDKNITEIFNAISDLYGRFTFAENTDEGGVIYWKGQKVQVNLTLGEAETSYLSKVTYKIVKLPYYRRMVSIKLL